MGGGVSKKPNNNRVCPEDICLDDFEKIKKIFKQLEKNKHSKLENLELEQISAIHIKNEIKKLKWRDIPECHLKKQEKKKKRRKQYHLCSSDEE